jgi:hypothetical protein
MHRSTRTLLQYYTTDETHITQIACTKESVEASFSWSRTAPYDELNKKSISETK